MIRFGKSIQWLLLPALALAIGGCSGDETSPGQPLQVGIGNLKGTLVLTGSSTMFPLIQEIARRFEAQHPEVHFEIQMGGSLRGISDARQRKADIGMSSRALNDNEHDLSGFPIARDGVCFVVNKDNPIESLSNKQLADIYLGKVTNWQDLGGKNAPIVVVSRTESHSSLELVESWLHINRREIKAQAIVGDVSEAIEAVAKDRNAIVFDSLCDAERRANRGAPVRLLSLDGIAATERSVRSAGYPLSRSLLLVTSDFPAGLKKAFIDFALSSQVTDLIRKYNFVPFDD
jgi:phosphate transport system substrate-binding protein